MASPVDPIGDPTVTSYHHPDSEGEPQHIRLPRSTLVDRLDDALINLDRVRQQPTLALALAAFLAVIAAGAWWVGRPAGVVPVEARIPLTPPAALAQSTPPGAPPPAEALVVGPESDTTGRGDGDGDGAEGPLDEPGLLLVHVAGAVAAPGIVELEAGSRIADAVEAAGGPSEGADLHQLNLAAPVADGMQIRVPLEGEVAQAPMGTVAAGPTGSGGSDAESGAGSGASGGPAGPIDVNRASVAALEGLPGIGPSLAAAIVDWRETHGPFVVVDDLLDVPGIGPAKLATLADHATT